MPAKDDKGEERKRGGDGTITSVNPGVHQIDSAIFQCSFRQIGRSFLRLIALLIKWN